VVPTELRKGKANIALKALAEAVDAAAGREKKVHLLTLLHLPFLLKVLGEAVGAAAGRDTEVPLLTLLNLLFLRKALGEVVDAAAGRETDVPLLFLVKVRMEAGWDTEDHEIPC
jgi:hypothetical protein